MTAPVQRMLSSWQSFRALSAATIALAVVSLPIFLVGALAVQLQADLGLSGSALGRAFSLFFGVAALASAPMGRVSERLGPATSLRLGIAISGSVLFAIAVFAHSVVVLSGLVGAAGMGAALSHPAANLLLARTIPASRYGLALGIKQSGIPVATLLAGLAVPILALTVGWRLAFLAAGVLAALAAAAVTGPDRNSKAAPAVGHAPPSLRASHLVLLSVGLGFGTAGATSIGAFTVTTLVANGFSESAAGLLFSAGSCVGIATRVIMGSAADRGYGGELQLTGALLLGGVAGYVLMAVGGPLTYLALPLAFGAGWGWLGLFDLAILRLNPAAPAAATGVTKIGAFVGGVGGPSLLGVLADHVSLSAAWLAAAVFALVAAVSIVSVAKLHRSAIGI